jgi:hypothetical protein
MDMGMEPELLIPGMQRGEKADFRAEVFRIASDFEKCFRTGTEQQIVDDFLQSQWSKLRRKCEDHMDLARREKFSLTCGDPTFSGRGLTLRAVSIAAAVVGDGGTLPAAGALIEMTPSAAARQRAMASSTLMCFQLSHWRFRSMKAAPALRMRSATSRGGRLIYSSCVDQSFSFSKSRGLAVAWS